MRKYQTETDLTCIGPSSSEDSGTKTARRQLCCFGRQERETPVSPTRDILNPAPERDGRVLSVRERREMERATLREKAERPIDLPSIQFSFPGAWGDHLDTVDEGQVSIS